MPPRKSGRSAAEAAYAELLKERTALVGDVGAFYESYRSKMEAAIIERDRYEQARAAAIKAGAITSDQLDQLGYKKAPKPPSAPGPIGANGKAPTAKPSRTPAASTTSSPATSTGHGGTTEGD